MSTCFFTLLLLISLFCILGYVFYKNTEDTLDRIGEEIDEELDQEDNYSI